MADGAAIDPAAAAHFVEMAFEPQDWVAVFLKNNRDGRVAQRVTPRSLVGTARFQRWLCDSNGSGLNVYISVNAFRVRTAVRRRQAVSAVRHVFLDADRALDSVLASIAARRDLPPPSYVLRTSDSRGHILWRVRGFAVDQVEALEKYLARQLDTDRAATTCSQLTRLPGFVNHKRTPAPVVSIHYGAIDNRYDRADFPQPAVALQSVETQALCDRRPSAASVLERARRYLCSVPPAFSGQHGDVHTFRICYHLVRGFTLADGEALALLTEWNAGCRPPWTERELVEKLRYARRYGREPIGGLLGDRG